MNPEIWGPHGWFFLHSITLAYPDYPTNEDKMLYKQFFHTIGNVLPCDTCKVHFAQHSSNYPIDRHLDSKESLSRWLVTIHNMANDSLGKKRISYDKFISEISKNYQTNNNYTIGNKEKVFILVVSISLLIYYFNKKNILRLYI
jgi:hypothetical protein